MPQIKDEKLEANVVRWTKLYRASLLILVTLAVTIVGVVAFTVNRQQKQIKVLIEEGRASRDFQTQNTQGYIKCIILLRYDRPDLSPTSSRQDVEMALDKCAVSVHK